MTEDHDSRISELYRQSSQETPPAYLDRAVMDKARMSVRRRVFSPFGNHWVAGGAMVTVIMLSVLLILTVPPQPDTYAPGQDAVAPLSEDLSGVRKEKAQHRALPSEPPAETEAKREAPAAPKARFDFYEALPDMEMAVPEEEARARMKQEPALATEMPASKTATVPVEIWYLQAGSFRDGGHADELKAKLSGLGFQCEIQEVSVKNDIYHRVRVGPFADPEALAKSRQKLDELGIETQTVKDRE